MEVNMQKLKKVFEDLMVAITFAESGEYDEARKLSIQDSEIEVAVNTERLNTSKA
jgi:hypothetical protein